MLYTCNHCLFTFNRTKNIETCPDCGKADIREATEKEKNEYKKNRAEFDEAEKQNTIITKMNWND